MKKTKHKYIPCLQCQRRLPVINPKITMYLNCNQHSTRQLRYQRDALSLSLSLIDGNTLLYGGNDSVWLKYDSYKKYIFDKILSIKIDRENTNIIVGLDAGKSKYRLGLLPTYKANRPPLLPERKLFVNQVIIDLKKEFKTIYSQGIEFDDIAGLVARQADIQGFKLEIATIDKDLIQLVSKNTNWYDHDRRRKILVTQENMQQYMEKLWGLNGITSKLDINFFIGVKVLAGDGGDNIKGFPSLGVKKAVRLIDKHGIPKKWKFKDSELVADVMATKKKYWATIKNPAQAMQDLIGFNYKMMDLQRAYTSIFPPQTELELIDKFMDIVHDMNQPISESLLDKFR